MYAKGRQFGKFVLDIDIGGTFTDAIVAGHDLAEFFKVDTTPHDLSHCLQDVFERAIATLGLPDLRRFLQRAQVMRLSTSLSTNTLVERKGARCGLMVTKGWGERYLSQPLSARSSFPLIYDNMVVEIDGEIGTELDPWPRTLEDEVRENVQILVERGATIIVVSLFVADSSPERERQVKNLITRYYPRHFLGSVPILLGSQVSSSPDFLTRTNTALLNAYCNGAMSGRLYQIEEFLRNHGYTGRLLVVHSSGGSARTAKTKAIQTINSGSAAGIFGVSRVSKSYDLKNIISLDAGGTSTEIGILQNGEIVHSSPAEMQHLPLDLSLPVASTLGIGGGSIIRIDRDGELSVGPDSAGAFPGPACYDLGGTKPTLTDAYLVLGYLDENYFLGGRRRIKKDIATRVITEKLANQMGLSCEEAALKSKYKAVEIIAAEIGGQIGPRGLSPADFSLVAIGGGGGCLGADLATYLGMRETYLFRQGAVFGAYGSSGMDIMHLYETSVDLPVFHDRASRSEICQQLNSTVASLQRTAFKDMRGEGFSPEEVRFELEIELNCGASETPIRISLPNPFIWPARDWATLVQYASEKIGSRKVLEDCHASIAKIFLRGLIDVPHAAMVPPNAAAIGNDAYKGRRQIYLGRETSVDASVYEWNLLSVPAVIFGPAIIESQDTTVVVPPHMTIRFDAEYNGVIRQEGREK